MKTHKILVASFAITSILAIAAAPESAFAFGLLKKLQDKAGSANVKKVTDGLSKAAEASKDIAEPEEIQMGDGIGAMILGASPLLADQNLQRYVNKVGRWVASQSSRPDLPWTFAVIDAPTVNAFALPGGRVFVSAGMVAKLNNESELAGVLAHEIAHVMMKHQVKAIQSARLAGVGKDALQAAASEAMAKKGGNNALVGSLKNAAAAEGIDMLKNGIFLRPLDKALEYDADRYGALLAAKAGYDPYGLAAVIQTLARMVPAESTASLIMSTHPSANDRLAELEKFASTIDRFSSQPQLEERFVKVISQIK